MCNSTCTVEACFEDTVKINFLTTAKDPVVL